MEQKLIFIIRNGSKVLVEYDNDIYRLPMIKIINHTYSLFDLERKIKEKYSLEVIGLKEAFLYESVICYEAYLSDVESSTLDYSIKWITIRSASNHDFINVDSARLSKFLRSLQSASIKLQYGLKDGKIIHISELSESDRGLACLCICPACEVKLQARLGKGKRRPHFSHNNEACNIENAQQTALHLLAKEILTESNHIKLPAYVVEGSESGFVDYDCSYKAIRDQLSSIEVTRPTSYQFDNVVLEKKVSDIVPDILIWRSSNGKKLIIEIAVTHFVDNEKREKIKKLGISALEIDLSQLPKMEFDRNFLKDKIIERIDSKAWIHNMNYSKALDKLAERNSKIADQDKKEAEATRLMMEKFVQAERKKVLEEKQREQTKIHNVINALADKNYSTIVGSLRNDVQAINHFKRKKFYNKSLGKEIPFFLDIPVMGQIAFSCDRRIWQMDLFELFIYYRNAGSNISIIRIWRWFSKHEGKKFLNWNLIIKNNFEIGNKNYKDNLALDAIKRYLSYLAKLGFIDCYGDFIYRADYEVISKTILPPNQEVAEKLEIAFNSLEDDVPLIDSDAEKFYNYLFS